MSNGTFLDVPGGRLYYEVAGSGPALVLIHAGIATLRMWDPQVPEFAKHYRVIRYDTRGFGQTDCEHVEYRNYADVAALLDHLGESSAHILGCSRGGAIALDFTLAYPGRARSLVFVCGGIGGFETEVSAEATALNEKMEADSEAAWDAKDWVRLANLETAYWVDGPGQPIDRVSPEVRELVYRWIFETYADEKEEGMPQRLDPPAAERLANLRIPILSMAGEFDEAHTTASCRHLADVVPGTEFRLIEGTAHLPNLERPDEFTTWVLDFLAKVDAPA